jgi:hypothetical protein
MDQEVLWLNNPGVLTTGYLEILPREGMTKARRYNAITRLLFIGVIAWLVFDLDTTVGLGLMVMLALVTYLGVHDVDPIPTPPPCRGSTVNNPAGNPLVMLDDWGVPACDIDERQRVANLTYNVYEDSFNASKRRMLTRAFYTVPVTTFPNDVALLGKALYGDAAHHRCKDGREGCEYYRDVRFRR